MKTAKGSAENTRELTAESRTRLYQQTGILPVDSTKKSVPKQINNILEDIQEAQVDAGGAFIRRDRIADMKVGELLELLVPNNVEFQIKYIPK